ncbi:cytochrome c oxidase subunit II [bacterium (Candidatus Blackallbacteria) CG17_big_fil_post_rev_8_21_14_2_50_48_46]|uniref:cytochrome-c oxidase n=1 Tax=bacterium (Candidatus Blackallbacteria) CG17_big_fil_post_rev_8_21_14_2_50_48_46 TaxID=2014261 RepID=A0A2M7GB64_9BACT|nr:MAG: cytochrome c oxidase subunit II [bacterium (Candidatus Blackallbacteria) CG18_big_fil_WC_8_21_14_2_50_49_26]PIW19414.1 MAG: cytochrome c oxidase subunit II [bacterium (Candidatus Blackallbacteria) CG17_big_fil_post_rev_8_21_14_2_50_48_46]PIW48982.1 MAG: cytochrome c oxidase subunit II [bacterium (Candidatus Blackallbacteria) CG13_big_fil_rev_8_21_14_2_50_49_14]
MNFLPLPENISTFGVELDSLAHLITIITMTAFVIAEGILFYFILRFRKKANQKASYIPGNNWKQLRWIFIPLLVVVGFDFLIDEKNTHAWTMIKQEIPEKKHYELVEITGQQFSWLFRYPGKDGLLGTVDDFTSTNELHIPVNETIVFYLKAKDVLHSFYVPNMRFKQDAVPGRTIKGWFDSTKTGTFDIACAEICGGGHSIMKASLIVQNKQDYQNWIEQESAKIKLPAPGDLKAPVASPSPTAAEHGTASSHSTEAAQPAAKTISGEQLLKDKGCLGCHTLDGSKLVGPTYKGLVGRKETILTQDKEHEITVDEAYLRRSIQEPNADIVKGYSALMPQTPLSEEELNTIINYLKELK